MERISRMEKAFYPRNDAANALVANLLPRDSKEDIVTDASGDPIYLRRSTILDGTCVKGFGYVDGKPYKWNLEIETAVKSVAVVPDRFYSIYGKSYPILRQQTVGINQPSESFKYEIVYMRGEDKYKDETIQAKIIYHRQSVEPDSEAKCTVVDEDIALRYLNDMEGYPYLKVRMCLDGSTRVYLGTSAVDWDLTRQITDDHADPDVEWVEVTSVVNTDQFRHMDLWVRFDSINALSYYVITKYENSIFSIGPKEIKRGLPQSDGGEYTLSKWTAGKATLDGTNLKVVITLADEAIYEEWNAEEEKWETKTVDDINGKKINLNYGELPQLLFTFGRVKGVDATHAEKLSILRKVINAGETETVDNEPVTTLYRFTKTESNLIATDFIGITGPVVEDREYLSPADAAGLEYDLEDPTWAQEEDICVPCCEKDNMSRAIWAYVNPKTMTPYDDDYWFHQGEPYYKKSLTLSTKQNPLKAQKIFVEQGTFPGMYKIVAETYIRSRDTGEDQRVQISLPLCKIKSDQTLTLQADGDPTTFNLDVEVATPQNGVPMEITFYEVEKEMKQGCAGSMVPKDGSTKISAK